MVEFGSLISGLGTTLEIAKTLNTLKSENERAIAVAELIRTIAEAQTQLLSTMQECFRLTEENQTLKKQLAKTNEFDRYRMQKIDYSGGIIFTLKSEFIDADTPSHDICPRCKEQGVVSYLTKAGLMYQCPNTSCKFSIQHTKTPSISMF